MSLEVKTYQCRYCDQHPYTSYSGKRNHEKTKHAEATDGAKKSEKSEKSEKGEAPTSLNVRLTVLEQTVTNLLILFQTLNERIG